MSTAQIKNLKDARMAVSASGSHQVTRTYERRVCKLLVYASDQLAFKHPISYLTFTLIIVLRKLYKHHPSSISSHRLNAPR